MNSHVKEMQKNKHDVWPFNYPPTPWTAKQIKEHAQQQRSNIPESPM